MALKQGFGWVVAWVLGTLPAVVLGAGSPAVAIDRAAVEQVRAGIRGRTIIVDWHGMWDYSTIQAALDASTNGDTIIVLPSAGAPDGAYVENVIFAARAITLRSINPADPAIVAATVIDGNAAGSVVKFAEGTPPEATVSGFTITHGSTAYGGGLLVVNNSSPTIANNTITNNFAYDAGGGIHLGAYCSPRIVNNRISGNTSYGAGGGLDLYYYCSPTIADNTISGNRADGFDDGYGDGGGGGLSLRSGSSPTITNNAITGNGAHEKGGGIRLDYFCSPVVANNTITGNSSDDDGGGLSLYQSSPAIVNNTISGNRAGAWGGGLYLDNSSPTIANNVFLDNTAFSGGGLHLYGSSPTMANNTIVGNGASYSGGGLFINNSSPSIANVIVAFNSSGVYRTGWGALTLQHNCVYGNAAYDYSGLTDPTGTDGNISVDPLLADLAYGNAHLEPNSLCVDAGDNAYVLGDLDIDGQPRIQPGGGTVDIGADESDGTTWGSGPYVVVRVSPEGDDAQDGSSWVQAKRTVQAGIDAAAEQGGEVWVQTGTYHERITLCPYTYVYGGFTGSETRRGKRDWNGNATILDGQQLGSVVTAHAGGGAGTLDGFTIIHGSAEDGGGIYLYYSSPTIANNTITSNSALFAGGGMYLLGSHSTLANNTIIGNSAGSGGGLYLSGSPTIANTIVAFNSSGIRGYGDGPVLRHNCVYGNSEYNFLGLTDPTGTDGNISTDPRLAAPEYGNTHLEPGSPCADAGENAYARGNFDVDGQARIQPAGGTVDIGADESDGTVWGPGPYVIVRVSPLGDDAHDGSSWTLAKRTVQAGIDAAAALGGEVWVATGEYLERITLLPFAHVYGGFVGSETQRDERDWSANLTVLDGQQQGSVVSAQTGYRVSTIDGFFITNGNAVHGGGINVYQSSPTIAHNTINGNNAAYGGGMYLYYCSPILVHNAITGNSATGSGGGLCLDYSSPTLENHTITGNSAQRHGGGLLLSGCASALVHNAISGNSATESGGGMYLSSSSPTIANNTITGNSAASGGGVSVDSYASPTIANNTVNGNSATSGGGLYVGFHASPTVANNTFTGNSASSGGGLYMGSYASSMTLTNTIVAFNSSGIFRIPGSSTATLRHNCVYGNTAYNYSGITDPTGTSGNISVDPLLADLAHGNARLQAESPCVDAGSNGDVWSDFDVDGHARILDGDGDGTAVVDIGAYEYLPGDLDSDGDVDLDDFALLTGCLQGPDVAVPPVCWGADLDADADVDLADFALFARD
jgi:parallel beta-helix repeat protein